MDSLKYVCKNTSLAAKGGCICTPLPPLNLPLLVCILLHLFMWSRITQPTATAAETEQEVMERLVTCCLCNDLLLFKVYMYTILIVCGLGLALCKQPTLHIHILFHDTYSLHSLTVYNREGLASFPGLPRFLFSVCVQPKNEKRGRPGNEAREGTLHVFTSTCTTRIQWHKIT